MPSTSYTAHTYGCIECDWIRLRKWAIDNRLIDEFTGPANMVDTIINLTARMETRIQQQSGQIEALRDKMSARA